MQFSSLFKPTPTRQPSPPPLYVPSPHPSVASSFPRPSSPTRTLYTKDKQYHSTNPYPPTILPPTSSPDHHELDQCRLPAHLTSRPLLFLTLLSPPVLGIIIILTSLILITSQSHSQIASAKREILAGCAAAEKVLVALNALPDVLEEKSLAATVELISRSVRGVGTALMLALNVVRAVLEFLIDTFRSVGQG